MKCHVEHGCSRQNLAQMRRWFKILCIILHSHGYGAKRLNQIIEEISDLTAQAGSDEVFWEHADKLLVDQIGLNFDRENYGKVDK